MQRIAGSVIRDQFSSSSYYNDGLTRDRGVPYTELAPPPYHTLNFGSEWRQPKKEIMNHGHRISTSTALAMTPMESRSNYGNSSVCIDYRSLEQPNSYQSQGPTSTMMNDEHITQTRHDHLDYAGHASQKQITPRSNFRLAVSMVSIPAITRTSYPVEVLDDLTESTTSIGLQIEIGPRTSTAETKNNGRADTNRRIRGRNGSLGRERAKKVHAIRKVGACFHCWARKTPVSQTISQ